tara:strand:- start:1176 stop:1811 length:636 start_codon:yes stop_codon:yes gene_type:complete
MPTKVKRPTIITPEGIARYPWVNNPDTKFVENGEYRCAVVITKKEATAFSKQLNTLFDAAYEAECAKQDKQLKKASSFPVAEIEDGWEIRGKLKAKVVSRDGTVHELRVGLFDSQGKPHPRDVLVGGGSKIRMAVRPKFWFVSALGFGVTLELDAVQIIDLQAISPGERSAESFGFTSVEGGYVHGGETFENQLDQPDVKEEKEELLDADF